MPLLTPTRTSPSERSPHLLFWQTTETEAELLALLPPQHNYGAQAAALAASPRRRAEWLTVRVLLHRALGQDAQIAYLPTRRPYLTHSPLNLSVSHSHGYVALALAPYPVGMDIELWGTRALRLSPRFLTPEEQNLLSPDPERQAVMLWSAKESAYKFFDPPGLTVSEDIQLTREPDATLRATLPSTGQSVALAAEYLEHFVLTYTLPSA